MLVERNVPSLGIKGVRKWLDKRCEKRVAKEGPIPAPTQPLPWDHFRKMPHRLKASRHLGAHISKKAFTALEGQQPDTGASLFTLCNDHTCVRDF